VLFQVQKVLLQRWAAAIHGKTREFSPVFREGISETLVLLAVHGASLFKERLGVDCEFPLDFPRECHRDERLRARCIEAHPELFVQAVAWAYKRKDGGSDPAEFQVPPERVNAMAERGFKLLEAIERIPGHNDLGELEANRLAEWIATVRQSCTELGRAKAADLCIGKVLSCAPVGKDGVWPCEPVRQVIEDIQSEPMMSGAHNGIYNSRGAHFRGEGGDQERELAQKYRKWGEALQLSHPFVAARLLMELAKTYDRDASREDTEAGIRRRLH
jgi:hypothetical protein